MNQLAVTPIEKKPKGRAAFVLLVVLMVCVLGLLTLPWILNRPAIGRALLLEFKQRTGHELIVEASDVRLFPSVGVELRQAEVRAPDSTTPLLSADRLEIALQWLPLLEGRVVAKDLVIDRPRFTVSRATNGTWSLGGPARTAIPSKGVQPGPLLQVVRNLLVVNGVMTVIDESALTPRVPTYIMVTQATLATEMMGRHAKLQISGEIPQDGDRAAFIWDGSLTQNQEGSQVQVEGDLRLHHINLRHLVSSWTSLDRLLDGFAGSAQLTAHLRWSAGTQGSDLIADEWRAELAGISLQGEAAVRGLEREHPLFSVTMSAAPVMLRRLLSHVPSFWVTPQVRAQLEEHGVDGLVSLDSLSLSGKVGARPSLSGSIGLRNGHMTVGPHYPSVEGLSGSLSFDDAQMQVRDLRAQWGPLGLKAESLVITQWLGDAHVDARIVGAGSLAELVETARRIEEVSLLRDVMARVQEATGEIEMVAHLVGNPTGGKWLTLQDIDVRLHNAGFRSAMFPVPLHQVQAHLRASPSLVTIEHLEGEAGPATLDGRGTITWAGNKAYSDFKVTMISEASKLWAWIVEDIDVGSRPDLHGDVRLHASVTGTVEQPRIAGRVELDSTDLHIPNILTKPVRAPAAIDFDSRLSEGNLLTVRHLGLSLPPIKIVGDGTIRLSEAMAFAVNVSSGTIALHELPVGIALGPIKAGTVNTKLHMEGDLKDRRSWRTSGEIRFDHGTVIMEGLQAPIHKVFVTLRFDQDRILIPRMAFHVGASDLRISGSIAQWADRPKARLVVESSQIDLAAFEVSRPRPSPAARHRSSDRLWMGATLNAFLFADHVYYKKFLLTGLSTKITWDDGLLSVERISGDTNEGQLAGQVKIRAKNGQMEQARSTFRASGIPVERVLSPFQEKPVLSGWLTTSGKVQAEFERGMLLPAALTSRQPLQILVEQGRMYQVPVLSTLLSLLNLPAVLQGKVDLDREGMPFDRLKLAGSISNGVVHTREFLLDSPVLKISGTGRYDILADEFDMVLATSPLGSYSALLKRIPLFGYLLTGDRQGFDTAVFELKGSANKPQLRYLPAESLMTGVKGTAQLAFDILVNAITLPQKAFSIVEEGITGGEEEDF